MRLPVLAGALLLVSGVVLGQSDRAPHRVYRAGLNGYQEVSSVSTAARGRFFAKVDPSDSMMEYTLGFEGLEGPVRMAHIHFGNPGTSGGVMLWLCGTAGFDGPAGTPVCPVNGAVRGSLGASDVVGPSSQGIDPGEWREALRALAAGAAYVNVHSDAWPGGEIRGQVRASLARDTDAAPGRRPRD